MCRNLSQYTVGTISIWQKCSSILVHAHSEKDHLKMGTFSNRDTGLITNYIPYFANYILYFNHGGTGSNYLEHTVLVPTSVAQWIACWTSIFILMQVIQRLHVRIQPELLGISFVYTFVYILHNYIGYHYRTNLYTLDSYTHCFHIQF